MDSLYKLELKFGRYAIPNLMLYIMLGQAIVLLLSFFTEDSTFIFNLLCFNPILILKGQIWRLLTFIFIPITVSPIWFAFATVCLSHIGKEVEKIFGSFTFNIYYLLGMVLNVIVLVIMQLITYHDATAELTELFYFNQSAHITLYLNLSLLFAHATLFPDNPIQVAFICVGFPVKIKYFAKLGIIISIFYFIGSDLTNKALIAISTLNYLIFLRPMLLKKQPTASCYVKASNRQILKKQRPAFHKCTVCGKTELTDPDMEFRYCSKCNGHYEYCMDHLHNHEHIK